jgi:hypothetical protein
MSRTSSDPGWAVEHFGQELIYGHGYPGQGISQQDHEAASLLLPGCCPCISCLWKAMFQQVHIQFLMAQLQHHQRERSGQPSVHMIASKLEEVARHCVLDRQQWGNTEFTALDRMHRLGLIDQDVMVLYQSATASTSGQPGAWQERSPTMPDEESEHYSEPRSPTLPEQDLGQAL